MTLFIEVYKIEPIYWQWWLLLFSSIALFIISPRARNAREFFKATFKNKAPNTGMLTGSLIISWIFAKSITNAANLGLEFGIVRSRLCRLLPFLRNCGDSDLRNASKRRI